MQHRPPAQKRPAHAALSLNGLRPRAVSRPRFTNISVASLRLVLVLGLLFNSTIIARSRTTFELPNAKTLAAQESSEARVLEAGQTVERELRGKEQHSYRIALASGQYARVVVEQRGVNVSLTLYGADGALLAETDKANAAQGAETLSFVAETAGVYRLEVRAPAWETAGRYEARIAETRQATAWDRSRAAAERTAEEARRLSGRKLTRDVFLRTATEKYEETLKLWREAGDSAGEAETLETLGDYYLSLNEHEKAQGCYEQAAAHWRNTGDRASEGRAMRRLGNFHGSLGDRRKEADYYEQALALHRAAGDRQGEAEVFNFYGWFYWEAEEYQKALESFDQSLALYQSVGDRHGEAVAQYGLGLLYWGLGDYQKSLEAYGKSLSFYRAIGNLYSEMRTLDNMGLVYHALGEHQKALECYAQTLAYRRAAGLRSLEADTLTGIGTVYASLEEHRTALEYLFQGLAVYREVGNRTGESYAQRNIGYVHITLKEPRRAIEHFNEALALDRALGERSAEARALAGLARAHRDVGELLKARAEIEAALDIVESLRSRLASQELRASYFASKRSYYEFYVDLLMRLDERRPADGHEAEALRASERARARGLLDLLAEAKVDLPQTISPELRRREDETQARITTIQSELIRALSRPAPDKSHVASLREELKGVESERERLTTEIRAKHPRYAELKHPLPLDPNAIRNLLDSRTALLEYMLGEDGSFLFVVSREGVRGFRLPPAAEINRLVREARAGLEQPGRREFNRYTRAARRLYEILIAPAAQALGQKQRLLVAPDGALYYLPFEVLLTAPPSNAAAPKGLSYLLERWAVGYVPSASVLDSLRRNRQEAGHVTQSAHRKDFVAFADPIYGQEAEPASEVRRILRSVFDGEERLELPRLKDSGREAASISNFYERRASALYLGDAAKEENVKTSEHIGTARRIHFASHGLISERAPQYSGLVLTLDNDAREDGLLQVYEIFNLKLSAELVVLSACRTGLGREVRGEGVIGLTRAFLYAGASSVAVSLWQVADRSTSELMISFYENLGGAGGKAEALRRAKLKMIAGGRYAHPYYWAPFILVGESE